jgi:hypothetical protein
MTTKNTSLIRHQARKVTLITMIVSRNMKSPITSQVSEARSGFGIHLQRTSLLCKDNHNDIKGANHAQCDTAITEYATEEASVMASLITMYKDQLSTHTDIPESNFSRPTV